MKALTPWLALVSLVCAGPLTACGDSSESAESSESAGGEAQGDEGEGALERARHDVDEAHEDFKESVKPAAEFVDEKTNEAVDEGKKAVDKVADTVSSDD